MQTKRVKSFFALFPFSFCSHFMAGFAKKMAVSSIPSGSINFAELLIAYIIQCRVSLRLREGLQEHVTILESG